MAAIVATLTVRNLDDDLVSRLRVRAAKNGRSAEAEHREILRRELMSAQEALQRRWAIADEMEEFRRQTAGRGGPSSLELLHEGRRTRLAKLSGMSEEELSDLLK